MNCFAAVCFSLLCSHIAQAQIDETSARRFMGAWVDSFNKNDAKELAAFYETDERAEMLASNGLALRGHDRIAASYADDMKAVRFYDSRSQKMRIRVFDRTALVSFVHRFKYEILSDNSHRQVHIRTTTVLRHGDDGWRIVLEHSSPIKGIARVRVIQGDD